MSQNEWIMKGRVWVIKRGYPYLRESQDGELIVGLHDETGWNSNVLGCFIAINEPSEFYKKGETHGNGVASEDTHRWWYITDLVAWEDKSTGKKYWHLYVERTGHAVALKAGPKLFLRSNYSTDPYNEQKLNYIIVPGAWVSDVRSAVSGNTPGHGGQASENDPRTIILASSRGSGPEFPFKPGDKISNPPGPEPWLPTAFRARHFNSFPAASHGHSFVSDNRGSVQLPSALHITGGNGQIAKDRETQKDHRPRFNEGIYITATTGNAIRIKGDVDKEAIFLDQGNGNEKKITWTTKGAGVTLYVDPNTRKFMFSGAGICLAGNLDYKKKGAVQLNGLSSTETAANNLRGCNEDVVVGETQRTVSFSAAEADTAYALFVECSWITNKAVTSKSTSGFTVDFDQPAPADATLDWLLVR